MQTTTDVPSLEPITSDLLENINGGCGACPPPRACTPCPPPPCQPCEPPARIPAVQGRFKFKMSYSGSFSGGYGGGYSGSYFRQSRRSWSSSSSY